MKRALVLIIVILLVSSLAFAGERKPVKPAEKDKCPVCGMFVAKYPDFVAEIIFKNGSYAVFDGVKDMMKYYFDMAKYDPSKKADDIDSIYVTDYYSLTPVDGHAAFYVLGSDVYGPMGKELVPFGKEKDAQEFKKDHKGKAILKFKEITAETLKELE
ncbi:MAG: nitrous oxide reductase accessory protein NosL [Chloroflexota bacterium]